MAGGLLGDIWGGIKSVGKVALGGVVGGITGGPLGAIGGIARASGLLGGGGATAVPIQPMQMPISRAQPQLKIPSGAQMLPGPGGTWIPVQGKKRRRMNPGNAKALRRAIRREEAFVGLAKRALKGSKYTVTTRGASRPRRDLGPGHRHVR